MNSVRDVPRVNARRWAHFEGFSRFDLTYRNVAAGRNRATYKRGLWTTGMDCRETLSMLYRSTVSKIILIINGENITFTLELPLRPASYWNDRQEVKRAYQAEEDGKRRFVHVYPLRCCWK